MGSEITDVVCIDVGFKPCARAVVNVGDKHWFNVYASKTKAMLKPGNPGAEGADSHLHTQWCHP